MATLLLHLLRLPLCIPYVPLSRLLGRAHGAVRSLATDTSPPLPLALAKSALSWPRPLAPTRAVQGHINQPERARFPRDRSRSGSGGGFAAFVRSVSLAVHVPARNVGLYAPPACPGSGEYIPYTSILLWP